MRFQDDKRVWLDRSMDQTVYDLFETQKFYSVECIGMDDRVVEFAHQVTAFHEWCKAAYHEVRAGRSFPELPEFLQEEVVSESVEERQEEGSVEGGVQVGVRDGASAGPEGESGDVFVRAEDSQGDVSADGEEVPA